MRRVLGLLEGVKRVQGGLTSAGETRPNKGKSFNQASFVERAIKADYPAPRRRYRR